MNLLVNTTKTPAYYCGDEHQKAIFRGVPTPHCDWIVVKGRGPFILTFNFLIFFTSSIATRSLRYFCHTGYNSRGNRPMRNNMNSSSRHLHAALEDLLPILRETLQRHRLSRTSNASAGPHPRATQMRRSLDTHIAPRRLNSQLEKQQHHYPFRRAL